MTPGIGTRLGERSRWGTPEGGRPYPNATVRPALATLRPHGIDSDDITLNHNTFRQRAHGNLAWGMGRA